MEIMFGMNPQKNLPASYVMEELPHSFFNIFVILGVLKIMCEISKRLLPYLLVSWRELKPQGMVFLNHRIGIDAYNDSDLLHATEMLANLFVAAGIEIRY